MVGQRVVESVVVVVMVLVPFLASSGLHHPYAGKGALD